MFTHKLTKQVYCLQISSKGQQKPGTCDQLVSESSPGWIESHLSMTHFLHSLETPGSSSAWVSYPRANTKHWAKVSEGALFLGGREQSAAGLAPHCLRMLQV